jgi:Rrf2 family cysteine metabolism transcriptional repressor
MNGTSMSFFNSKLRYGLCAAVDLAMQSPTEACQSKEIAARQSIPPAYLDQILAALKSSGIVRSVRGAGGGYNLARSPERIRVGDVVRALMRSDRLFSSYGEDETADLNAPGVQWVVREFEERIETMLAEALDATTLAELAQRKQNLDESLSLMQGI